MKKFAIDSIIFVEAETLDDALDYASHATGLMVEVEKVMVEDGLGGVYCVEFINGSEMEED